MWKNMVEPDYHIRQYGACANACWIPKATDTEYVLLIAFPRQKWLHERALALRYTCIACLVEHTNSLK